MFVVNCEVEKVSFLEEEKRREIKESMKNEDSIHCSEYCIRISKLQIKRVSDVKANEKKYLEIAYSEVTNE